MDLWKLNTNTLSWTRIYTTPSTKVVYPSLARDTIEQSTPGARIDATMWIHYESNRIFIYGGLFDEGGVPANDVWYFDTSSFEWTFVRGDNQFLEPVYPGLFIFLYCFNILFCINDCHI